MILFGLLLELLDTLEHLARRTGGDDAVLGKPSDQLILAFLLLPTGSSCGNFIAQLLKTHAATAGDEVLKGHGVFHRTVGSERIRDGAATCAAGELVTGDFFAVDRHVDGVEVDRINPFFQHLGTVEAMGHQFGRGNARGVEFLGDTQLGRILNLNFDLTPTEYEY